MKYNIAVIKGDGIGKEVVTEALKVLDKIGEKYGHKFNYTEVLAGGSAIDEVGVPLPEDTIKLCKESDSIILGAVGGPKWDSMPSDKRPEKAILGLRKELGLFANIRPAIMHKSLINACPLKENIIGDGLDICIIRELTGGLYFGEKGRKQTDMGETAYDMLEYSEEEIKRIAKVAFEIAMKRNKKVTSVDKANVLESSRLWRSVVEEMAKEYSEVSVDHMYIDNASMQLVINPKQFDVIVTENMFGDILSDEASMITGSIGMLPSASLGNSKRGLYEPIHGSAPDIAGVNKANPIATILSVAMMLRYSFGMEKEAQEIETAVTKALEVGYRTPDIMSEGMQLVSCTQMSDAIINAIIL